MRAKGREVRNCRGCRQSERKDRRNEVERFFVRPDAFSMIALQSRVRAGGLSARGKPAYRSMMVMIGATVTPAAPAARMSADRRCGRLLVFHSRFTCIAESRGDGRDILKVDGTRCDFLKCPVCKLLSREMAGKERNRNESPYS